MDSVTALRIANYGWMQLFLILAVMIPPAIVHAVDSFQSANASTVRSDAISLG